jgi:DNA polymerase iota
VGGGRRDIGEMFKRYGEELREFTVYDDDEQQHGIRGGDDDDDDDDGRRGGEGVTGSSAAEQQTDQKSGDEDEDDGDGSNPGWEHDDSQDDDLARCQLCDRLIPRFALLAHERYHNMEDPE